MERFISWNSALACYLLLRIQDTGGDDLTATTDSMFVYTEDNHVDLADLYPIFSANHTVNYTCPEGYVFDHSNNILMSLTCINGTWRSHTFFNASKFCTRK